MTAAIFGLLGTIVGAVITWLVAREQQTTQFRLAALDRRLLAHQKAYTLCLKMKKYVADSLGGDRSKTQQECQDWFQDNCLFLGPKSMPAFDQLLNEYAGYPSEPDTKTKFKDFLDQYWRPTVKHIAGEVALPATRDAEE